MAAIAFFTVGVCRIVTDTSAPPARAAWTAGRPSNAESIRTSTRVPGARIRRAWASASAMSRFAPRGEPTEPGGAAAPRSSEHHQSPSACPAAH